MKTGTRCLFIFAVLVAFVGTTLSSGCSLFEDDSEGSDDKKDDERNWGIEAGFIWRDLAQKTIVYDDRGISRGMEYGIAHAKEKGLPVEYRKLGLEWISGDEEVLGKMDSEIKARWGL